MSLFSRDWLAHSEKMHSASASVYTLQLLRLSVLSRPQALMSSMVHDVMKFKVSPWIIASLSPVVAVCSVHQPTPCPYLEFSRLLWKNFSQIVAPTLHPLRSCGV